MPARDTVAAIDEALTGMDRLDPAPVAGPDPSARSRAPARRKGMVEAAVARDLKMMPAAMRGGAIAATALKLARELDTLPMTPRDAAGHARELRMHMAQLAEMAPGDRKGDVTDEVRARREARLAAEG
jgi:hypothetical protein